MPTRLVLGSGLFYSWGWSNVKAASGVPQLPRGRVGTLRQACLLTLLRLALVGRMQQSAWCLDEHPHPRGHRAGSTWSAADAQGPLVPVWLPPPRLRGELGQRNQAAEVAARGHVGTRWHPLARACAGKHANGKGCRRPLGVSTRLPPCGRLGNRSRPQPGA